MLKSPYRPHKYPTNFGQCHWTRIEYVICNHSSIAQLVHNWIWCYPIHNTADRKCVDLWADLRRANDFVKLNLMREFLWIKYEKIQTPHILARSLAATVNNAAIIKQMEITSILSERFTIIICSLQWCDFIYSYIFRLKHTSMCFITSRSLNENSSFFSTNQICTNYGMLNESVSCNPCTFVFTLSPCCKTTKKI